MSSRLLLALTSLAVVLFAGLQWTRFGDAFLPGDSFYYAQTALSLLHDGDFDLGNQLNAGAKENLKRHEGFFAVAPDGRVVPKHSTLLPIVSLSFVALFGQIGFLIANVVIAVVLVLGVANLAGNSRSANCVAFALFVTSSWLGYCFNYSPDLLLTALITWSYAMARSRRWFWCGLLAGLAVWAKVYACLILLPLVLVVLPAGGRAWLMTSIAALIGIIPMLIINHQLYGGMLETGYDRDARIEADGFRLTEHYSKFHQPLGRGLLNVLFDPSNTSWDRNCGMVRTAPLWFLWPLGLILSKNKRFDAVLALGAMVNIVLFALYDEWNASIGGNRFLFPAVALGGALLVPILERFRRSD